MTLQRLYFTLAIDFTLIGRPYDSTFEVSQSVGESHVR